MPLRRALLCLVLVLVAAPAAHAQRPTDPGSDVYGNPNYQVAEETPYCLATVCLHWVATTGDAPADLTDGADAGSVPDAIEMLAAGAQHAYDHMTSVLGWRPPVPDGALGGGTDLVDVYVKRLPQGVAGVARRDADQQDWVRPHGWIVIAPGYASRTNGFGARKVLPHELQHLIEYAYDGYFESWNAESTAEWAAAQGDGSYDILRISNYVAAWAGATEYPMVAGYGDDGHPPAKAYVDVMWQRWLSDRYGPDLIREVWERSADQAPGSFAPLAVEQALGARSTFFDELVDSSVAAAEWRTPDSGFAGWQPGMPDVERVGTLQPGGDAQTATLDHTTFSLLDVPVSDAETYELRASAPEGVHAAVALVGRRGGADDGTADTVVQPLPDGGEGVVGLADPSRYERITAVLVNADTSIEEPYRNEYGGFVYARDDVAVTARIVKTDRPPPPPVAPAESPSVDPPPELPRPPEPPPVVDDLVAPRLLLAALPRRSLARLRAGRPLRLDLGVDERSTIRAQLVLRGAVVVAEKRANVLQPGRRTVTLRPTRKARRRLARARRVTLVVTARDVAGNVRTLRRAVR